MSNRNQGEIPWHRKPKVSLAMVINQGLGGPKLNPKGVGDGQSVNIPTLQFIFEEVTQSSSLRGLLDSRRQSKDFQGLAGSLSLDRWTQMSRLPRKTSES